jgi:2-polyprenyl-3-methyl-5-hydroxy-6-metoxy-1,4-benzoquinol methylase
MADAIKQADIAKLYDKLYSTPNIFGSLYGANNRRNGVFVDYIRRNIPIKSTILDAGCGRGFLIRWLNILGYKAEGTEIADCLFNPGGELYGMPAKKLFYSQLNTIPDASYDVVISDDVIEHLPNETEVEQAVRDLVRISNKWVLISTGGMKAATSSIPGVGNIHFVIRPKEWWVELARKYYKVNEVLDTAGSLFLLGEKL